MGDRDLNLVLMFAWQVLYQLSHLSIDLFFIIIHWPPPSTTFPPNISIHNTIAWHNLSKKCTRGCGDDSASKICYLSKSDNPSSVPRTHVKSKVWRYASGNPAFRRQYRRQKQETCPGSLSANPEHACRRRTTRDGVSTKQKVSNNSATLSSDLHMHTMPFPHSVSLTQTILQSKNAEQCLLA